MKRIETLEQREKGLKWMVKKSERLQHPLTPIEEREKLQKIYDYTSAQVQEFNERLYAGKEYPPLYEKKPTIEVEKQDLSGWLDDDE